MKMLATLMQLTIAAVSEVALAEMLAVPTYVSLWFKPIHATERALAKETQDNHWK